MKRKINYIPQVDERDCGVAALSMVLAHYKTRLSLARLRDIAKTDMEGTTALGIVKAANALDFETMPICAYTQTHFGIKNILNYPSVTKALFSLCLTKLSD